MSEEAIVVGSGLSAIGAIRGLIRKGIKPLVLDVGDTLELEPSERAQALANKPLGEWTTVDRVKIAESSSPEVGGTIPRKLLFGSDFFYGYDKTNAAITFDGSIPPFSYALGGLSEAWGAASMPPNQSDMTDWPNAARNLDPYIELLLEDLPYSAADDGLSENFPLLTNKYDSLRLSPADEVVLSALSGKKSKPDSFLYGQARLLVYASDSGAKQGCKYCGCCMAGCAYGSIYKASAEIEELASKGLIEYKPGCLVDSVTDSSDSAVVSFWEKDTKKELKTDQLFLAAGAVNTTRIVMNSLDSYEQPTRLKSRGGYLVPIFSFRRLPMVWPATNTQPGVFVELNGKGLKNWVHIQISTENELLYKRLNYSPEDKGIVAFGKKFILEHVAIGFVNFHSDYGPEYELERRVDTESGGIVLHSKKIKSFSFYWVSLVVSVRLLYHLLPRGLLPVIPASISNSGSYHVGGTLPMRESPTETFETDVLGRPANWKRVFVVDTASFPSLPGTSIGLATMANAMRIALGAIGLKSR